MPATVARAKHTGAVFRGHRSRLSCRKALCLAVLFRVVRSSWSCRPQHLPHASRCAPAKLSSAFVMQSVVGRRCAPQAFVPCDFLAALIVHPCFDPPWTNDACIEESARSHHECLVTLLSLSSARENFNRVHQQHWRRRLTLHVSCSSRTFLPAIHAFSMILSCGTSTDLMYLLDLLDVRHL